MKKILVIEDHTDVRENIAEILDLAGYYTFQAPHGKEGVRIAVQEHPDLIICDIMMPELDGYGVLHILNKRTDTSHIPFIFLSAKAEKDDFRKGMNMGADDYLTKPFDDKELLQAIELRLSKRVAPIASAENNSESHLNSESLLKVDLQQLFDSADRRSYDKKDIIFNQKDRPRYLYQLKSGSVKLYRTNEEGKEVILKLAKPGEFFGYLSLFYEDEMTESAATMERSEVLLIPKETFFKVMHSSRQVTSHMIQLLAQNAAEMEERLLKMAYNSVRKKVAEALLFVYRQKANNDNTEPLLHIQRDDLAGIAGTAKETAIRTLADFKEEKLIAIEDRSIRLLNVKKLEELPN
ncbi:MAG: response regulator [Saprospiraceae bacterium]|nr:response regulator [Saprospiraceae bacterium]